MSGRLSGKVAIVTGGGNGIGRATVARFIEEGARVVVADVDVSAGQQSAADSGGGERVLFVQFDAGDEASWRSAIAQTLARFGAIDIIVNNAALRTPLTLEQTTLQFWHDNQRVTSDGVFLGTKLAGEAIRGRGAVVNVSSIGAFVGLPASLPYSAAKGAVRALSRSAALHFAATGRDIRVNVVAPGATLTDAVRRQTVAIAEREGTAPDEVLRKLTSDVPIGRMAEPREIAEAILFLASDEASFITGAELIVDGGATAR